MTDIHITAELLEAVRRGELHPHIVLELGWDHLLRLCPTCRDGVWTFQERTQEQAADYETAFRLLPLVIERHAAEDGEKRQEADRDMCELLGLTAEQRLARIRRAGRRFKGAVGAWPTQ
ncbi:MAG TPA: hypothetical protein VH988_28510 [Thermoanaerobaculia bacterium]|nr:hypothetical protein [Thermoanaerobaculia bacterium]